jgi:tetratricopeptide (TPR) repeat protein
LLEIAIIVSIAAALLLLLRNFHRTKDLVPASPVVETKKDSKMLKFWQKWTSRKQKQNEDEIKEAIRSGQSGIVSPKEIQDAQDSFDAADPRVAKLLFEANEAYQMKDFKSVEEKSIEALSIEKRCDQAYAFVALVAIERKDYTDAEEASKTALKCNSENGMAHAILGEIYLIKERYTEAIAEYLKAVNLDRNNASWQAGLGKSYMQVRQFSKAAKALKRASSLDIDSKEYRDLAFEAEEKQRAHANAFGR